MKSRILFFIFATVLAIVWQSACFARGNIEQRPSNFVFLIDVSGSMLFKNEMVKGPNGQMVTLFEALRDALKQIVSDDRLLTPQSKVAFITFGTNIEEKDWPNSLDKPDNRATLISDIASPDKLQADKHGDTYMAGALQKAYEKAEQFSAHSAPCTTCFIVMLTDGWDEAPHGAALNVRDQAARIVQKQAEMKRKLGVNTWQVRIVGLQRLPDRKAGTTTAAEVASLLGGDFLDVTKQANGTVAQRIFAALEKTISELQGKVEVAGTTGGGFANFGVMQPAERNAATIPVVSRSCYGEQIDSVADVTATLSEADKRKLQDQFNAWRSSGKLKDAASFQNVTLSSVLPSNALTVQLEKSPFLLTPTIDQMAHGGTTWQQMPVVASVGSKCPPGAYIGALKINSSAQCEAMVPYAIAVPSRIVTDAQVIRIQVKKPSGICWAEPTSTQLKFAVGTSLAGNDASAQEVAIEPEEGKSASGAILKTALINHGQPMAVSLQMNEKANESITLPIDIPADFQPGEYSGRVHLKLKNAANAIAPAAIAYTISVLPSPWEQVRPIAIPILALFALVVMLWLILWIAGKRS